MLRPMVSRPVCLGIKHMVLTTRFSLLSDDWRFVDMGRPLWREDGSVVYNCSRLLPVQTFSGPTPMGLMTIIYCLRFETSLFVASYDSQGYGGGIRVRLNAGAHSSESASESYITTDGQSASLSWNKAYVPYDQIFITVRRLAVCWYGAPSLTRGRVLLLQCTIYNMFTFLHAITWMYIQYIQGIC
jgi:hypothetical protein